MSVVLLRSFSNIITTKLIQVCINILLPYPKKHIFCPLILREQETKITYDSQNKNSIYQGTGDKNPKTTIRLKKPQYIREQETKIPYDFQNKTRHIHDIGYESIIELHTFTCFISF